MNELLLSTAHSVNGKHRAKKSLQRHKYQRIRVNGARNAPPPFCSLSGNSLRKARSIMSAKVFSFPVDLEAFPLRPCEKYNRLERTNSATETRVRSGVQIKHLLIIEEIPRERVLTRDDLLVFLTEPGIYGST